MYLQKGLFDPAISNYQTIILLKFHLIATRYFQKSKTAESWNIDCTVIAFESNNNYSIYFFKIDEIVKQHFDVNTNKFLFWLILNTRKYLPFACSQAIHYVLRSRGQIVERRIEKDYVAILCVVIWTSINPQVIEYIEISHVFKTKSRSLWTLLFCNRIYLWILNALGIPMC